MPNTLDQQQAETSQEIIERLQELPSSPSSILHMRGSVGTGKTATLRKLSKLAANDFKTVFVRTQSDPAESGATVLAEMIDSLRIHGILSREDKTFEDARCPWDDKFALVKEAVNSHQNSLLLICDEPSRWFANGRDITDAPDREGRMLSDWIFEEIPCRRVVSGFVPAELGQIEFFEAPAMRDGQDLLSATELWTDSSELALQVAKTARRSLYYRGVLDIRLLVARQWLLESIGKRERIGAQFSATSLLEALFDELHVAAQSDRGLHRFCQTLSRMSLGRTELPEAQFASMTRGLDPLAKTIIAKCLCEENDCRYSLHPLIRYEVLRRGRERIDKPEVNVWRLEDQVVEQIHGELFNEFRKTTSSSLRADVEIFHHGVLSTQIQPSEDSDYFHFVHQLLETGRSLSYVHHQHRQAAEVFKLALQFDPGSGYAHHYYAFNLDWNGEEQDAVEEHYQKAIELEPKHPWRWSRWIAYLETVGQQQRSDEQWRCALNAMSIDQDTTPGWIYFSLHRWVARWMLHWSRLDVAHAILESVPKHLFSDASFSRLNDYHLALREAKEGRAVFPLSVPASQWWNATGHAGLPGTMDDRPLTKWLPARLESIDEDEGLYLTVGRRPATQGRLVDVISLSVTCDEFNSYRHRPDWSSLTEGSYLELGYYGQESSLGAISIHDSDRFWDPDLIPLAPPPDRWFNKAVDAAWLQPNDHLGDGEE